MKQFSLISCIIMFLLCACSAESNRNSTFINSTYSSASLLDDFSCRSENVKEFDFIYCCASPKWTPEDMDMSQDEINRKIIDSLGYEERFGNDYVYRLITSVHQSGGKILCTLGGKDNFNRMAENNERRKKFANMLAYMVDKYGFDGIDIDWERTVTIPLHNKLMHDIRSALDNLGKDRKLYLVTALSPVMTYSQEQADSLASEIDWINLMCYGMGGGIKGKSAGHNTPFSRIRHIVSTKWNVFPNEKICIGLASYGFVYRDMKPQVRLEEGDSVGNHRTSSPYNVLLDLIDKGWTERPDTAVGNSYFISPGQNDFASFETEATVMEKVEWAIENQFKGIFWWEFHRDWVPPVDGKTDGSHLLTDFVSRKLGKSC